MRNWYDTVTSQFATAPTLLQLIRSFNDAVGPDYNLEQFYDNIWNIGNTAQGAGLDVWGRIVGVNRNLQVAASNWFGFAEAGSSVEPFGQGAFYSGESLTSTYALTDQAYLTLIFAKAAANITNCSIPAINAILMALFPGRGNAYVTDGSNVTGTKWFGFEESGDAAGFNQEPFFYNGAVLSNMTLTYVFEFPLQPFEASIVETSGVLPKPVGVKASAQYPGVI